MRAAASDSSPSDESRRLHDTRTRSATWETAAATAKSFIDSNSASTSAVDTTSAKRKPAAPRAPRKRPNRKTRTSEVRRVRIAAHSLYRISCYVCIALRVVLMVYS